MVAVEVWSTAFVSILLVPSASIDNRGDTQVASSVWEDNRLIAFVLWAAVERADARREADTWGKPRSGDC